MNRRPLEPTPGYVALGLIVRPWGLDGSVKIDPMTDFPDRFEPGATLWIRGEERRINRQRLLRDGLVLTFDGCSTREQAEELRNLLTEIPESELRPLGEDEYYEHQLRDLTVIADGKPLGTIVEILQPGPNSVFVVRGPDGDVLIPYIDDVVKRVDLAKGEMHIELIDGLLPEPPPPPRVRERRPPRHRRNRAVAVAEAGTGDTPASTPTGSSGE